MLTAVRYSRKVPSAAQRDLIKQLCLPCISSQPMTEPALGVQPPGFKEGQAQHGFLPQSPPSEAQAGLKLRFGPAFGSFSSPSLVFSLPHRLIHEEHPSVNYLSPTLSPTLLLGSQLKSTGSRSGEVPGSKSERCWASGLGSLSSQLAMRTPSTVVKS